jgi:single-strand DNA-binding protein
MAGSNINRVIITGNLTRDPELRTFPEGGTSVCSLRIACNGRRKNGQTGQWEDQPNYFDVTVWGAQGENCMKYLSKGRGVAIDGRLRWREWTGKDEQKRQAVDIIAESVQFLGGREDAGNGNGFSSSARASESDVPIDTDDFDRTPVSAAADEDIPF